MTTALVVAVALFTGSAPPTVAGAAAVEPDPVLKPNAEFIPASEVEEVTGRPYGTVRVVLEKGADPPETGDPFVVPVSPDAQGGVLGVAESVEKLDEGGVVVESQPVPLDEVYSQLEVSLEGRTLDQLDRSPAAPSFLRQFKCTVPDRVANSSAVRVEFGKLEPVVRFDVRRREFLFSLTGRPRIVINLSTSAKVECKYVGDLKFVIPIAGSPVVITVSPAMTASAFGKIGASFTWSPRIELGVEKKRDEDAQGIRHLELGSREVRSFDGKGHAELFLGFKLGVSLAERLGIEGSAGPKVEAELSSDGASACFDARRSLHLDFAAYVDVFLKHWEFDIAETDLAKRRFLHAGVCPPGEAFDPDPVLAADLP